MCVLVIGIDVDPQHRLVVAANRDEQYARPATAPRVHKFHDMHMLAPRDAQAGGTWEGIHESGLIVVITNRPDGDFKPQRVSRGLLCLEALELGRACAVRDWIEDAVRTARYNSFNLFYADTRAAFVSSWNGELTTQPLERGTHVLSNLHGLGELGVPELDGMPHGEQPARALFTDVLASHAPRDANDFRICKHGDRYGTVSSSLLYTDADGSAVLEHAPGPPCTTAYQTFRLETS